MGQCQERHEKISSMRQCHKRHEKISSMGQCHEGRETILLTRQSHKTREITAETIVLRYINPLQCFKRYFSKNMLNKIEVKCSAKFNQIEWNSFPFRKLQYRVKSVRMKGNVRIWQWNTVKNTVLYWEYISLISLYSTSAWLLSAFNLSPYIHPYTCNCTHFYDAIMQVVFVFFFFF